MWCDSTQYAENLFIASHIKSYHSSFALNGVSYQAPHHYRHCLRHRHHITPNHALLSQSPIHTANTSPHTKCQPKRRKFAKKKKWKHNNHKFDDVNHKAVCACARWICIYNISFVYTHITFHSCPRFESNHQRRPSNISFTVPFFFLHFLPINHFCMLLLLLLLYTVTLSQTYETTMLAAVLYGDILCIYSLTISHFDAIAETAIRAQLASWPTLAVSILFTVTWPPCTPRVLSFICLDRERVACAHNQNEIAFFFFCWSGFMQKYWMFFLLGHGGCGIYFDLMLVDGVGGERKMRI